MTLKNLEIMRNIFIIIFVIFLSFGLLAQNQSKNTKYTGQLDILNHLQLSEDEEDVLYEILLIDEDIKFAEREIAFTTRRISELKEICKLSAEFEDIQAKADRKYNRSLQFVSFLKSDLEEYRSIEKKLIYEIYANQLLNNTNGLKFKKNAEVKKLKKEAEMLNAYAEQTLNSFDQYLTDQQIVDSLSRMNCLYTKAIDKQRAALAICLNISMDTSVDCEKNANMLMADNDFAMNIEVMENEEEYYEEPVVNEVSYNEVLIVDNNIEEGSSLLDISQTASDKALDIDQLSELNQNITYKVQVGAFYSSVDKSDFKGLNPINIEESEDDFSKVMVGSYYSYKAAMKAREILIKTTNYNDAFVVAYENDNRISLAEAIGKMNNSSDKEAYISFKNHK
jgi:hypothetical protein